MNHYDVGDQPRLAITFEAHGIAADPTAVTITVRDPADTLTTPSVTNPSVGSYYADVPLVRSGTWTYRWAATGALVAAEEASFYVRERLT